MINIIIKIVNIIIFTNYIINFTIYINHVYSFSQTFMRAIGKQFGVRVVDPLDENVVDLIKSETNGEGVDAAIDAGLEIDRFPPEQQPGKLSAHINATQIVTDIAAAKNFYQDILGFKPIIEIDDEPMLPEPAPNVFGLPDEVALRQNWNICLQEAPAGAGGWVEIVSLPGLSGRDFAERTDPPNRGIISLRFPVNDLLTLHDYLLGNGVCIVQAPTTLHIEPYGDVSILTARGPQGVRLDFFQTLL